jgi:hypothetical protein
VAKNRLRPGTIQAHLLERGSLEETGETKT